MATMGKYHGIKVRLKNSGYQLQYRTGYSSVPSNVKLARAMNSPLAASMQQSTIPITIDTGAPVPSGKGVLVPLQTTVPSMNLQFLPTTDGGVARVDLYVTLFDDRGRVVTRTHFVREAHAANGTEAEGSFKDSHQLLVRKGVQYRVVVALHDQITDAIGITSKSVRF
jgi:hypothetical protein